jgi:hypothetical protein
LGSVSVTSPCPVRIVGLVIDDNHEALACWVIASGAGVIGAAEQVVRGVEEPRNITGFGTPEKSHSAYPCEVAGGSSLA